MLARAYIASFLPLIIIDACWLFFTTNFYRPFLGHLMADSPQWWAAIVFYVLYAFGITVFVVVPHHKLPSRFVKVFLKGALFGLVAYGTFDLTNQALLKGWPILITLVDLAWGAFLTGSVSVIAWKISSR